MTSFAATKMPDEAVDVLSDEGDFQRVIELPSSRAVLRRDMPDASGRCSALPTGRAPSSRTRKRIGSERNGQDGRAG